ncbi:MAG: bifunctional alpha,alpha-trehalose-phosphate synthase (UDP-forming)/trehalose-phosphatase [Thermodesulfovibrionia bacterium]|nr:bifunctional alpha,alpha-trehalose-phosphate synthase (UDP-forming)/trehalose-phosphatase [Thermodesulfovibrionia bacterium]
MSREKLKIFIEKNLSDKNLVIVSNREPYIHKKFGNNFKVEKPVGGLSSALDEVLKATGGKWVAWGSGSGDRENVDGKNCISVPPSKPSYILKRVWLTPEEINNYYHGYANQVLWPLCHITLDRVYFKKKYWTDYKNANRIFAHAVLSITDRKSLVWIHDYHLCLVPKILKEKKPDLTVAHFWHIPWPDYSVFRICPQFKEILEALLCNDLIGFQIPLFINNFLSCVKETLEEAEINYNNNTVSYNGHLTVLKSFPISVDFDSFDSLASAPKTSKALQTLTERYNLKNKYIGIGVDRLEYTKGLIKRLQAIDLFFEKYPKFIGTFTFIQIAVPTRMKEPYATYKLTVEVLIKKINKKYALEDWNPIIYRDIKSEHEDLVAYYRMADVGIISSIYDGMNLVAKEFVASQCEKKGVLLLSEFAGAAEELEGAILVNPYDIEEFSNCIKTALELPVKEKACRINALRRQVKENDIYRWILDVLRDITVPFLKCYYVFDNLEKIPRNNIFLFFDFDGTLTPIVSSPDKAHLSEYTRNLILRLNERYPVAIISGRALHDIKQRVNLKNMIYAGNHGAEIWDGQKLVVGQQLSDSKKVLSNIIDELKNALSSVKGTIIEDKGITASIHYRMVDSRDICTLFDIIWTTAHNYKGLFKITSGKKVFEIKPHGTWNKGDAVKWICEHYGKNRVPVYLGDDTTDEDAFNAIKGKGTGISIGRSLKADYYLKTQGEVKKLLQWIENYHP